MKRIISLFAFIFIFSLGFAQSQGTPSNVDIHTEVDEMASYPGGLAELHKFLGINTTLGKYGVEGEEAHFDIQFVVEKDGSVHDIKLSDESGNVSEEIFKDYVQALERMPNWTPAKKDGQVVKSLYTLPIHIKFHEELKFKKAKKN
ncbi:MAG TPA: energy transducer TonB [Bacteroidales bacterium]|nr:energy transducer TonB [Bacteroidales bacterium]